MTKPISWSDAARLESNARHHRHDAVLELACELWDTDRAAFDRLPASIKSQADVYRDLRQYHRDAIAAGVITDDRGSAA
jgi:hypothetical protein